MTFAELADLMDMGVSFIDGVPEERVGMAVFNSDKPNFYVLDSQERKLNMDRALITLQSNETGSHEAFHLYITECTPKLLADILKKAIGSHYRMIPGSSVGDLLVEAKSRKLNATLHTTPTSINYAVADYHYYIDSFKSVAVYTFSYGKDGKLVYSGTFDQFVAWANGQKHLTDYLGKVVRFKYSGGSSPGNERLVKVHEVNRIAGGFQISGQDVEKVLENGEDDSYRHYNMDKVSDLIVVI